MSCLGFRFLKNNFRQIQSYKTPCNDNIEQRSFLDRNTTKDGKSSVGTFGYVGRFISSKVVVFFGPDSLR